MCEWEAATLEPNVSGHDFGERLERGQVGDGAGEAAECVVVGDAVLQVARVVGLRPVEERVDELVAGVVDARVAGRTAGAGQRGRIVAAHLHCHHHQRQGEQKKNGETRRLDRHFAQLGGFLFTCFIFLAKI